MAETDGGTIMPNYAVIELKSSAIQSVGKTSSDIPYVIWTTEALDTTKMSGYFMDLYEMDQKILSDHKDIVGTVAGPVSWYMIY